MGIVFSAGRLLVFCGTAVPFDADATGTTTAANANVASPASTAIQNRFITSSCQDVQKHAKPRRASHLPKQAAAACDQRIDPPAVLSLI
jgi:hypothetical protein